MVRLGLKPGSSNNTMSTHNCYSVVKQGLEELKNTQFSLNFSVANENTQLNESQCHLFD